MQLKKSLLCVALTSFFAWSAPAHAIGDAWQVDSATANRLLSQIKSLLETEQISTTKLAGWQQRGETVSIINHANIQAMNDLKKAEMAAAPTLQKCIAISSASGNAGIMNAVSTTMNSIREQLAIKQNAVGRTNLLSNVHMDGREETCSLTDVNNGVCKKVGELAGWADKYDSLIQNPTDKHTTLTDKQVGYATNYINSLTYSLAPDPETAGTGGELNSEQAAALRKVWTQRMSPTVYALNQQLANSKALPKSSPLANMWNTPEMKNAFTAIYGANAIRPETPSPRMWESIMAMSPYTEKEIQAQNSTVMDIETLRRIEKSLHFNNYLQLRILAQLEISNAQIGSLNAQNLSNVSNDNSRYAGVGK